MVRKRWRVARKCSNCPFSRTGEGAHLRRTLRGGRWTGILAALRQGNYFPCHKTTQENNEGEHIPGSGLVCAGSIEWQNRNGFSSAYVRLCQARDVKGKR